MLEPISDINFAYALAWGYAHAGHRVTVTRQGKNNFVVSFR